MPDLDWMDRAACRDTDPRRFFPTDDDRAEAGKTLHLCRAHCPVRAQCENRRRDLNLQLGIIGGNHWVTSGSQPQISRTTKPTAHGCELGCPQYRQRVECPTCGTPVAGLITGCPRPACVSADIAEDHTHVRRDDR